VAEAFAQAGDHTRAEHIARSLTDPGDQAQALAGVAGAFASVR
jgi:hypothetical protein